jgi:hypothetical protein
LKNFEAQQSKINATKNTQIVPECLLSVAGVAHRRAQGMSMKMIIMVTMKAVYSIESGHRFFPFASSLFFSL